MGHYRKKSITTQNYEEFGILCAIKFAVKMQRVQTHNFDTSFLKTSKTGAGTKQF